MHYEITQFTRWLRCKHPQTSTHRHYTSNLKQFFTWANKPPNAITITDVYNYITHAQTKGHVVATINRRLASLSSFYQFLHTYTDDPPANPVIPRQHFIKQGRHLPRDVPDETLCQLFAAITSPRGEAIFTLILHSDFEVVEANQQ